ncbi:ArsC family reductase [Planctobacterium marinum]|uniref:ArsC family reductase n=1 Tax=Planctobacterium marinum TaxID=1631968 RepID=UPI001E5CB77D|nr:ArsC family reductase [Planctobacterium marinum]MCC2604443.1 ArsC family reductase [Planctobacterium marinum]
MTTVFGIKNCDTIKKTKKYLETKQIDFRFHDYRVDGIDAVWLEKVLAHLDWEKVLNKRGTTYRQLSDDAKTAITRDTVTEVLVQHPAMIKRPIIEHQGEFILGFSAKQLDEVFA